MDKQKKLIIIGLDGMGWPLTNRLIKLGIFSNIKKIIEQGSHGILKSTYPPVTGPAWTSFATGTKSSKHKCYEFIIPDDDLTSFHPISAKDIHGQTFYEILNQNHKKSILINLPNSYPPRTDNPTITSLMTRGKNFVFPEDLKQKYPKLKKYRLVPNEKLNTRNKHKEYFEDIYNLEQDRFEAAKDLFKKESWDCFFYLFSGTDWIQHLKHHKLIKANKNDKLFRYFKYVDSCFGWLLENMPEDANLLIMSDHGFKNYKGVFNLNKWLYDEGYLKTKIVPDEQYVAMTTRSRSREKQEKKGIVIKLNNKNFKFFQKFPILGQGLFFTLNKLKKILPIVYRENEKLDITKTKACLPNCAYFGCIYINDKARFKNGIVDPEEKQQLKLEIKQKLEKLNKEKRFAKKIFLREELYPRADQNAKSPDIYFELDDYYIDRKLVVSSMIVKTQFRNKHHMNGIIIGYGPDIKKNTPIKNAQIYDLTPTILKLFDIQSDQKFDGKTLDFLENKSKLK